MAQFTYSQPLPMFGCGCDRLQRVLDIVGVEDERMPEVAQANGGLAVVAVPQQGDPAGTASTGDESDEEQAKELGSEASGSGGDGRGDGGIDGGGGDGQQQQQQQQPPIKVNTGKPAIGPTGKGAPTVDWIRQFRRRDKLPYPTLFTILPAPARSRIGGGHWANIERWDGESFKLHLLW